MTRTPSIDHYLAMSGPGSGMRITLLRAGDWEVEVVPDRGMDIGRSWWRGKQVAWIDGPSIPAAGAIAPGDTWLETFRGGLLATCGPENFGRPSKNGSYAVPLHGSWTRLRFDITESRVSSGRALLQGTGWYSSLFGDRWEIDREINVSAREGVIVRDRLINRGAERQPVLVLYHVNLGGELIGPTSRVSSNGRVDLISSPAPFDDSWDVFGPAHEHSIETVYRHLSTAQPIAAVAMSPETGMSATISSSSLSTLFQWKYRRHDRQVLGMEPATSTTLAGREQALADAPWREIGEEWTHTLGVSVAGE